MKMMMMTILLGSHRCVDYGRQGGLGVGSVPGNLLAQVVDHGEPGAGGSAGSASLGCLGGSQGSAMS